MITREEMLERLDECWDSTERGLYPDDNNSSDTRQVSRNIAARDAIRALLTAPTFKIDCPDCFGDDYTPCSRCVDGQITVVEVKEKP
jgi:hypothetical protein